MTKKAITDLVRTVTGFAVGYFGLSEDLTQTIITTAVGLAVIIWTFATKDNK